MGVLVKAMQMRWTLVALTLARAWVVTSDVPSSQSDKEAEDTFKITEPVLKHERKEQRPRDQAASPPNPRPNKNMRRYFNSYFNTFYSYNFYFSSFYSDSFYNNRRRRSSFFFSSFFFFSFYSGEESLDTMWIIFIVFAVLMVVGAGAAWAIKRMRMNQQIHAAATESQGQVVVVTPANPTPSVIQNPNFVKQPDGTQAPPPYMPQPAVPIAASAGTAVPQQAVIPPQPTMIPQQPLPEQGTGAIIPPAPTGAVIATAPPPQPTAPQGNVGTTGEAPKSFCVHCGAQSISPGANFCSVCGQPQS